MIASLAGTSYFPNVRGGILFLEEVNESPFRIERMLCQLYFAGVLGEQKALLLGALGSGCKAECDNDYPLQAMVSYIRSIIGIPVITGLPIGHCPDIVTLPVGGQAQLIATKAGFSLRVWGYPHAS